MLIPDTLMLAVCAFGEDLPAQRVVAAHRAGRARGRDARAGRVPDRGRAAGRLRRADAPRAGGGRGRGRLDRGTLAGSPAFEIATRARQAGVPAYAVTGVNELDAFDARMLDLQVILQASDARA